jgi:RNA polymerase sigma-70 factor (ECF subfamily)
LGLDFPTTHWSVVVAVGDGDPARSSEALATLYRAYWRPLYVFIRHRGHTPEATRDFLQAFFTHLIDSRSLARVTPEKGHFRAFLLTALKNLLADEKRRETAMKRGAGRSPLPLDVSTAEGYYRREPVDETTPDTLFEKQWALTVLDRAMDRLRRQCEADGCAARFEHLRGHLVGDIDAEPYDIAARRLGLTPDAVRKAVSRLRRRFGRALRDEIGQTVSDAEQVDAELHHLLSVLRS